ncbi:MAG TPA: hemolysin, partial [Bacteroidia bacterium]|nr:hemolysin [Bacteroidia bacterium]
LFNSYMNLSATMKTFGTSLNDHFGEVEETGIMVTISEIYETKKERHISTYHSQRKS